MGSRSGFDADLELDELLNSIDRGSGGIAVAQRQANAQFNLGLIAMAGNASGGTPQGQVVSEAFAITPTAGFALSNVATAQKAFGNSTNGTITLLAGVTYGFELVYQITNTGTTSHTWAILFGGTATFTYFVMQGYGNSSGTANAAATGGLSGFTTAAGTAFVLTAASTSATEQVSIEAMGEFKVNAGGTFIPQVQMSAAPGGAQAMVAGSMIEIFPQQPNASNFLGNWS
jgi:hypothetical protein